MLALESGMNLRADATCALPQAQKRNGLPDERAPLDQGE
jgi:hypothetical protein